MEQNNKNEMETSTIETRQRAQKKLIIESLKETPIIQYVCKRANIGRTTFYRWCLEDKEFAKDVDEAIILGSSVISDLAETQLVTAIRDGDVGAIKYWLSNHHKTYSTKLHITTESQYANKQLTPEQKVVIEEALEMMGLDEQDATETNDAEPSKEKLDKDNK